MRQIAAGFVILEPHSHGIGYEVEDFTLRFRVFSVCQYWEPGYDVTKQGQWELIRFGETAPISAWKEAENDEISGWLKWDGCINWQTNSDCMAHGCGPGMIEALRDVFAVVYRIGKRHFDLLGDEVPPMPDGAIEIITLGETK